MQQSVPRFAVSIKGILQHNNKFLLRKNQRNEFELPGGRLERTDPTPQHRLITEFREESGIRIEVLEQREPWFYEVGAKHILIVPFLCRALEIPEALTDEDGGTLHWLSATEAANAPMPRGYKDTILGAIPRSSKSPQADPYFRIIPNYEEASYRAQIRVRENGAELLRACLPHGHSPRDFIRSRLGGKCADGELRFEPISIDQARETISLNYRLTGGPQAPDDANRR